MWHQLEQESQLDTIDETSFKKPLLIFKHSTRCSVSFFAKKRLKKAENELSKKYDLYYLDLIKYREISNHIAARYSVQHESPQVLKIENAECKKSVSHSEIIVDDLLNLA